MTRYGLSIAFLASTTLLLAAAPAPTTAPAPQNAGYLFVTFKGEQSPLTEQIYFGLSADGFHWQALNHADPALVSTVGEKGVRDPYILRSHDNKKFFIVATDLSINLNKNWTRATHEGSKSVVIWDSPDLVHWSEPRLVKVAPDDAGCTWAPEAIYDEQAHDYMLYWASTTGSDNFKKQRIWAAHTSDFITFSKPEVFIEKPTSIIDTDIIHDADAYYRFSKNGYVTMEKAAALAGPWSPVETYTLTSTQGYEGPAAFPLTAGPDAKAGEWCLLLDFYSKNQGYKPFLTSDLSSGKFAPAEQATFPFPFRHGSVLPVTADEYHHLLNAYPPAATQP